MRTLVAGMVLAATLVANDATATVTLTASRPEILYTTDDQFDCAALATTADADLPWNVVRLRAEDDTGTATSFRWKLPTPNVGYLLRDDPSIDSVGGAFLVQAFCTDVGSSCPLTKETIDSYRRPTVLYAAPTCADGLPSNTQRQFRGDSVKIRVKADGLRGRGSKASAEVGWGRLGTPTLFVSNVREVADDGLGKKEITTFLTPTFSVTLDPAITPPVPIADYLFDNGADQESAVTDCRFTGAADGAVACTVLEYPAIGPWKPRVEVRLGDDSAYCDNATTRVATCRPKTDLVVKRSPARKTYASGDGDPEAVSVTLRNLADRSNGCEFIFESLTCDTQIKKGGLDETDSVTFVPARCEDNPIIFCVTDADCGIDGPCLSRSHCSETTGRLCTTDAECGQDACPFCEEDETCLRVIQVPRVIFPGQSAEILSETLDLRSLIPGKVNVTETWTITERFGRGDDVAVDRFKIRGER